MSQYGGSNALLPGQNPSMGGINNEKWKEQLARSAAASLLVAQATNYGGFNSGGSIGYSHHSLSGNGQQNYSALSSLQNSANGGNYCAQQQIATQHRWGGGVRLPTTPHNGNGGNWDSSQVPPNSSPQVHSGSNGSGGPNSGTNPTVAGSYNGAQSGQSTAISAYAAAAAATIRSAGHHHQHPQMDANNFSCLTSPTGGAQWLPPTGNGGNERNSRLSQHSTPPYHLQHSAFSPRSVSSVSPQESFGGQHGPQTSSSASLLGISSGIPSEGFGHSPRIHQGPLASPRGNPLPSPVTLLSSSLELEYLKSLTSSLPQSNPGINAAQFPQPLNSGGQLKAPQPQHQTVALPSSLQQNFPANSGANGGPKLPESQMKQETIRDDNTIEAAKAILSFQQSGNNGRLYESILSATNNNSVDNYQPISPVSSAEISPVGNGAVQSGSEVDVKVNGDSHSPSTADDQNGDDEKEIKTEIPRLEIDDGTKTKWEDSGFVAVKVEDKSGDESNEGNEPPIKVRRMSPRDEASTPPATTNGQSLLLANPMSFPLTPTPIINAATNKPNGPSGEEESEGRRKELPSAIEGSFTTPSSRQESRSSSPHSGSSRAGAETPHSGGGQLPTAPTSSMPLGGLSVITGGVIPPNVHTCQICGFTSASKFHFNSHMNTHTDHKCDFCDYTSRTEGRLKRHMKDFHSSRPIDGASGSQPSGHDSNSPDDFEPDPDCNSDLDMSRDSLSPGTPGRNRSNPSVPSKPKVYKCKQCAYVATCKNDFWSHAQSHIKPDKLLTCPKCSFVTEYKHHLEYHLRNHYGSKPFKCNKCNYSCVNKSMLNSHMKSHSNVYQYRCNDCTYATKYCHSLKLHLRKYGHSPATVINPDGSMIDASTIDVYGNRRGPRPKKGSTPPLSSINNLLQSTFNGAGPSHTQDSNMPTTPLVPFMEALQSTLLAQAVAVSQHQQNGVTNGSVTGSMGATLPTIASLNDYSGVNGGLIQLPTSHGSFTSGSSGSLISASPRGPQLNGPNGSRVYKCSMCEYASHTREALTQHIMVHIVENKELCHMYGIQSDNIPALAAQLSGAIRSTIPSGLNGSATPTMVNGNGTGMEQSRPGSEPMYRQTISQPQPVNVLNGRNRASNSIAMSVDSSPNDDNSRFSPGPELNQDGTSPASVSGGGKSGDDEGCGGGFGNEFAAAQPTRRRKAKAYKLDRIALKLQGKLSPSPSPHDSGTEGSGQFTPDADAPQINGGSRQTTSTPTATQSRFTHGEPMTTSTAANGHKMGPTIGSIGSNALMPEETGADWSKAYVCHYCDIAFKDCIMYTIHMGYHGYQDPFKCNMCGHISQDRLAMFLHIARAPHS